MTYEELDISYDMPYGWARGKDQPLWHSKVRDMWKDMHNRVKNPKSKSYKNYKDCIIYEDFKYLSNFEKWVEDQPTFIEFCSTCHDVSWTIDKDIKVKGNRKYYPEFMSLVPKKFNSLERVSRQGNSFNNPPKSVIGISTTSIIILESISKGVLLGFHVSHVSHCCQKRYGKKKNIYKVIRVLQVEK